MMPPTDYFADLLFLESKWYQIATQRQQLQFGEDEQRNGRGLPLAVERGTWSLRGRAAGDILRYHRSHYARYAIQSARSICPITSHQVSAATASGATSGISAMASSPAVTRKSPSCCPFSTGAVTPSSTVMLD